MNKKTNPGFTTRNMIIIVSPLKSPENDIELRIAPNITTIHDCTSMSVGVFFSAMDSAMSKYKITICLNGRIMEGATNSDSTAK
jgi:hypothetical protein